MCAQKVGHRENHQNPTVEEISSSTLLQPRIVGEASIDDQTCTLRANVRVNFRADFRVNFQPDMLHYLTTVVCSENRPKAGIIRAEEKIREIFRE